jgi:hypothetical protein
VPLLEQVVAVTTFWLGPTHADALAAEGNLAVAYLTADRADVGIPLHASVVAERERLLGADHPATLTAQDVLAAVHRTAGRSTEARRTTRRWSRGGPGFWGRAIPTRSPRGWDSV